MSGPPVLDWRKLFSRKNQPWVIAVALLVLAILAFAFGRPDGSSGTSPTSITTAPGLGSPVALNPIGAGQCRTFAPEGWTVADNNPAGTVFTLVSADRSMIATYAGAGINGGTAQGLLQEAVPPDSFVRKTVGILTSAPVAIASAGQTFGAYQVMRFVSGNYAGYVLYYSFALPADPNGYGIVMRIAAGATGDQHSIATAGSVAAAIRCQAIVIPQNIGESADVTSSHGTGTSANCAAGNCDDSDLAGTYNAQLGTGWVHDSTGRNYNVDVTSDYIANGPQGPGYYKVNGNDVEKLQPGLQ